MGSENSIPVNFEFINREIVSVKEAARLSGVTIPAIRFAIDKKRLKATKDPTSGRLNITVADLEEYRRTKYSRKFSMHNGKLVFDNKRGLYSVAQAAELIGVDAQDIYYRIRKGELKSSRNRGSHVLHIDDIKEYQESHKPPKDKS